MTTWYQLSLSSTAFPNQYHGETAASQHKKYRRASRILSEMDHVMMSHLDESNQPGSKDQDQTPLESWTNNPVAGIITYVGVRSQAVPDNQTPTDVNQIDLVVGTYQYTSASVDPTKKFYVAFVGASVHDCGPDEFKTNIDGGLGAALLDQILASFGMLSGTPATVNFLYRPRNPWAEILANFLLTSGNLVGTPTMTIVPPTPGSPPCHVYLRQIVAVLKRS